MKRFSFSTFQVDESNREAFDACRAIADFQPVSSMPVLLLGDQGCGKTHLLYSIVNHVRAGSATAGLACVTAREFPEKVRQLVKDPSPVERARAAILLVDQLESFRDGVEDLDAVARIFLDHGHYVLFASNIHPARLRHLTDGLRVIIERGRVLQMKSCDLTESPPWNAANPAMMDLFNRQQEMIQRLREELERARDHSEAVAEALEMRRQLEVEQRRVVDLSQQLDARREAQEKLDQEVERANAEVRSLRRELDASQTELASVSDLKEEIVRLTRQLEHAQSEREAAERERTLLVSDLAQKTVLEEEVNALRLQLHTAQQQTDQAQGEARSLIEQARAVLAQVEASRSKFRDMEQKYHDQIEELERRVSECVGMAADGSSPGESAGMLDAMQREYDAQRSDLEAQLAAARQDARVALKTRDIAVEKLDNLTASHAALEIEFEQVREQLRTRREDMEALRHEAAAQVAAANAQAGDVEREYARLVSTTGFSHQAAHVVVAGLKNLREQIVDASKTIDELVSRLIEVADRTRETLPSAQSRQSRQSRSHVQLGNETGETDASASPMVGAGNGRTQADAGGHGRPETADVESPAQNADRDDLFLAESEAASFDLDAVIRARNSVGMQKSPSES